MICIFFIGRNNGYKYSIINLLNEYEIECYNDSTLGYYWMLEKNQRRWIKCDSLNYVNNDSLWNIPCKKGYYHKNSCYYDFKSWAKQQNTILKQN